MPTFITRPGLAAPILALWLALSAAAHAEISIGVIVSTTGPGASLGQPEANAVKLWPRQIAGQDLKVTVLNDNTDSTTASQMASRLIETEHVDVIVGPSLTPPSMAAVEVAGRHSTPIISLGGGGSIVLPQEGPRTWAFKMSPPEAIAVDRILGHMQKQKAHKLALIAISTGYGEGYLKAVEKAVAAKGVEIVAVERYAQTDASVAAQTLKLLAAQPDAVFIVSAGTPGALPQIELARRGYKGLVYQTQGIANADFLRVGGADLDGAYVSVAPVLVAEQLPDDNVTKAAGLDFVKRYEGAYGAGSRSLFAASAWTAKTWLEVAVPAALKRAQPGTQAFREALRDALENLHGVVTPEAVFTMSPADHNGVDERAQVLVRIEHGQWKLVP